MLITHANARIPSDRLPEVKAAIEAKKNRTYKSAEIAVGFLGFDVVPGVSVRDGVLEYRGDLEFLPMEGDLEFLPMEDEHDDHEFIEEIEFIAPFLEDGSEFVTHCFFGYDEAAFRRFVVRDGKVTEYVGCLEWEEVDD